MAEQISIAPPNQDATISSVEELLLYDDSINDDDGNPLLDDAVNGMMEEISGGNVVGNHGDTVFAEICFDQENFCNENPQFAGFPQPPAFGNPVRIPVWPVPPSPHSCSCCQTLREIFHVNGSRVLKLGIHGRLGMISHAVMERYDSNLSSENHEFYMFEESISNVKQFLVQYCNDKKQEGYIMLQDPLSHFYDALCTGLEALSSQEPGVLPPQGDGQEPGLNRAEAEAETEAEADGVRLPKSYIASQRERTGNMTLRDLEKYFHLPMNVASKEINLCPSAIKSICRRGGLQRWPHRKIKSLTTEISKKQKQILDSADPKEQARLLAEMQQLQQELSKFYQED